MACGVKDELGHVCERDNETWRNGPVVAHAGVHRDKGYWWTGKRHRVTNIGSQRRTPIPIT